MSCLLCQALISSSLSRNLTSCGGFALGPVGTDPGKTRLSSVPTLSSVFSFQCLSICRRLWAQPCASRHPSTFAGLECFEREGLMPRSRFRGHINELVNLVQAELPSGSEAAGKYPQTAAALGALKEALRVEWGLDGQCVRRKRSFHEAKALKRVTSQL